ncbi:MAG: efflux RND transporter periplasmic adaptor subunit [Prolixibacteraceae bacterium]
MNFKIGVVAFMVFAVTGCNRQTGKPAGHEGHGPGETGEHDEAKFQYTAYSNEYELFAEADAFVVGETATVVSHFSALPDFRAVEAEKITMILTVQNKEIRKSVDKPTRKGIYSFDIKPETAGTGTLKFEVFTGTGNYDVLVPQVTVFSGHSEAHDAAEKAEASGVNATVFTKEQSWKIDFSTGHPVLGPFGPVIKATALIESSNSDEMIITAKTNGVVQLTSNALQEGAKVTAGQALFSIRGGDLADNNSSVRYAEAKSNFEKANADYERSRELVKDKIISEKDFIASKNQYENAKAVYDNLNKNFSSSGQTVICPMSGFVRQVFIKNGSYVGTGQAIFTVSQNKALVLRINLPQKYASVLGSIHSANIRTMHDDQVYSFGQLNGKVLSYGKTVNADNYLIPVNLQIDNNAGFTPGSFVEVFLKTETNSQAVTIPNTALLEEQGSYFVWVQITPELFEKREVVPGKTDGVRTEILWGTSIDERIVLHGAMILKLAQATGTLDAHSGHVH